MKVMKKLDVWGGIECSIIRLRDEFRDQRQENGHYDRQGDYEALPELGIGTLRTPVLWEQVCKNGPFERDWTQPDRDIAELRRLGITPIAGLTHHGSGPAWTQMMDPDYPSHLAAYAEQVALRYPDIEYFTPVNEPLTTARFSGLYGHWYPHGRDERTFMRILVNECLGTLLAMKAIRRIRPDAKLVQTEDLGRVFATPRMSYQAEFENTRRWLSLDLLAGRVDEAHPMRRWLLDHGIPKSDIDMFLGGEGRPDILGINHYPTSDRYLDEDVRHYPAVFHGGNGRDIYADVEALRVSLADDLLGPKARLREAWDRYKIPVAVTEAHHGSTRDEQVRWLLEVWNAARELNAEGADIRAVTFWALFGSIDWNSLVTQRNGFYEPGAFDVRSGQPRRTAIAEVIEHLAKQGSWLHPVASAPGWWRREGRHFVPQKPALIKPEWSRERPILITGATGTLGRALVRLCNMRALACAATTRRDLDLCDPDSIARAIDRFQPWAVINAAGYVRQTDAAREQEQCYQSNTHGAERLAAVSSQKGLPFVTFSSDRVFDGRLGRAYVESDATNPLCVYGLSKAKAETAVLNAHKDALVIRTAAFFGPWDTANFVWQTLARAHAGQTMSVQSEVVTPTYVPDLCNATLDLLIDRETGIWHIANPTAASWAELANRAARMAGSDLCLREPEAPRYSALGTQKGLVLPDLDSALHRFMHECQIDWRSRTSVAAE